MPNKLMGVILWLVLALKWVQKLEFLNDVKWELDLKKLGDFLKLFLILDQDDCGPNNSWCAVFG